MTTVVRSLVYLALACRLAAQAGSIPDAETVSVPTPARLATVQAAALRDGWSPQSAALRAAAFRAYERGQLAAGAAWLNVYRWSALFGEAETEFVPRWIAAVQSARVAHANMPARYEPRARPLAAIVSRDLQAWLVGDAKFSAEFFSILTPVDYLPKTLEILNDLHQRDPARFKNYASLALALAVVYDVPPPPGWPHGQVTAEALPRIWPSPAAAFAWWVRQGEQGRTYHRLTRLGADELKFVVDAAAPFPELEWAQGAANVPLNQLARAYDMIRYRRDRLTSDRPIWPGDTYRLAEILTAGGICADQAYFATQVGKARGVPTLLICGAGNDGRHAWFGFLDGNQAWQLDAGRYAEQRFVTGYAFDPQTWSEVSDHDLKFLAERFRALPPFKESRVHQIFAAEYLAAGQAPAAGAAARKAVNYERRNEAGWETLIAAARKEGRDAKTVEGLLREAALAFQRYPDIEARYVNRVADSLRARGETSAAEAEVRRISVKNKDQRGDLSVQQARDSVRRVIATEPLAGQIRAYNAAVDLQGRGAGAGFFDEVVTGFVEHLVNLGRKPEALQAIERAQRTLKVEPNTQLAADFDRLTRRVKETP